MTEGKRLAGLVGYMPESDNHKLFAAKIDAAIAEAKRPLIEAFELIEMLPIDRSHLALDIAHNALVADKKANP